MFYHVSLHKMQKNYIKEKCDAYRNMVKSEVKYIEAKEEYYRINKELKEKCAKLDLGTIRPPNTSTSE